MKVTAQLCGQFLLSSQLHYTGTYLAKHLAGLQHDNVQYFLKATRFTPRQLWQQVQPKFVGSARDYFLFDDTALDKHHDQRTELIRRQYSGNAPIASSPPKPMAKASSTTWPTGWLNSLPAMCPTTRCCWKVGTPPRPVATISTIEDVMLAGLQYP